MGVFTARGAQAQAVPAPAPFAFANAKRQKATVPFQMHRNLIIVRVRLNGSGPYNFMLDTGVAVSLLTSPEVADSLCLRRGQQFRVVGAGGQATGLLAYQTDGVRVNLGPAEARAMSLLVLTEDVLNLSAYVGLPVHGILGSELFRSFVVGVEAERGLLQLHVPASYEPPRSARWSSLPLSVEGNKPYLTAPVQLTDSVAVPMKLVLDTGAGHALSLEVGSHPRLELPTPRLAAELGRGLTGIVRGHLGRVAALQLGRYRLPAVLTSYPDSADVRTRTDVPRNGNIGYELLRRFSLVFDYPHQRLLLRPNAKFDEPFEHDMCGLDLLAAGADFRRFMVVRVTPGSPAAEAGIEALDELVSINFLPADSYSLTQLSLLLHSADGRLLFLVLRRPGGELHTAYLRLKRQI
jgi:hypothetical protein